MSVQRIHIAQINPRSQTPSAVDVRMVSMLDLQQPAGINELERQRNLVKILARNKKATSQVAFKLRLIGKSENPLEIPISEKSRFT
jgi:hypothetical protein